MNVIELKKMIYNFLITKSGRVFDEQAPAKVEYPYIVFSLDYSDTDDNQRMEVFDMTVDVFDNKQFDRTSIDALIGSIDGDGAMVNATGLHRKHYFVDSILRADLYRVNRDTIYEKDENISHIQLEYEVYTYLM
jgi:hypothetical protein